MFWSKDFKAVIKNNKIIKIGVDFFGPNTYSCFPMYKLSTDFLLRWLIECEKHIKKGELNIYAEDAFNNISDKLSLFPMFFNEELCMETIRKDAESLVKNGKFVISIGGEHSISYPLVKAHLVKYPQLSVLP